MSYYKNLLLTVIATILLFGCTEKGCTNFLAENYSETAQQDDGSCTYASAPEIVESVPSYDVIIDGQRYTGTGQVLFGPVIIGGGQGVSGDIPDVTFDYSFAFIDTKKDEGIISFKHNWRSKVSETRQYPVYNEKHFILGPAVFTKADNSIVGYSYSVGAEDGDDWYSSEFGEQLENSYFEVVSSKESFFNGFKCVEVTVKFECIIYKAYGEPHEFKTVKGEITGVFA